MFKLQINLNLNLFICFLLANCVSKVFAYPSQNFSCNCVLLKSCDTFNSFIDNSSDDTDIKNVIQEAVCFFDGKSIFVCCPDKANRKRNVKEKLKLDYLDELTGLNCPPSFGHEYDYDEYLKTHETEPKSSEKYDYAEASMPVLYGDYDNYDSFGYVSTQHYPSHHHHHYHEHDYYHHHDRDHHHHDQNHGVSFFPDNSNKPLEMTTSSPNRKISSNCGLLSTVAGSKVDVFPWITRLAYLNTTSRTIGYRCMGTIISDQHILTAAHCVDKLVKDLRLIYVRIGDDSNSDDYKILETIVHPNYNEPLFNNDVAILRLAITSQNKGPLMRICLPQNNSSILSGDIGVVAGWSGSSGISAPKSSTIRYINLPIMNNTECAIRYAKYSENFETSIIITPTEFCAKAQAMNDVCEGDSGGPFMERSAKGRYTLLGFVAFGPKTNCGQSNLPGVYMKVSSYVEWITNNII